jgi:hypothetical protein
MTVAAAATPTLLAVRDPARGGIIDQLRIDDPAAVAAAVERARSAPRPPGRRSPSGSARGS